MKGLEAVELDYRYPHGPQVLRGLSLSLRPGERVALVGANGAGKSTLLRCLLGLLRPSGGSLLLDGRPVHSHARSLDELRCRVGLLVQDPDDQLLASVVGEDVALTPRNRGVGEAEVQRRVETSLARVDLLGLREAPVHGLSPGQKRRVALAGLLAMEPELLILDEPSAGLDAEGCAQLLQILEDLHADGVGVLLATHDLDLAFAWADEFAHLEDGAVARRGPAETLFPTLAEGPPLLQVGRRLRSLGLVREMPRSWSSLLRSLEPPSASRTCRRPHRGQVMVCQGCCCGNVARGRPPVPWDWLAREWNSAGLNRTLQLTLSGCLGPCEEANVAWLVEPGGRQYWLGGLAAQEHYEALLEWGQQWASRGCLGDVPETLKARCFHRWPNPAR